MLAVEGLRVKCGSQTGHGHLGTQQNKSRNGAGKVEGRLRLSS